MFLHGSAAIVLVVPIVTPIANAIDLDPVQFGIIATLNIAIGQQTPPVASVLMTACSVAKVDVWDVTKVNVWFIAVLLIVLVLVTYAVYIPDPGGGALHEARTADQMEAITTRLAL